MAAEELESAESEFEWSFDNTSQLINLYETFPCLYAIISVAWNVQVSEFCQQGIVCSEYGSIS